MIYNEAYYKSANYKDYLHRGPRYKRMAREIVRLLESTSLLKPPILDYGCSVGFLVQALKEMNIDSYGFDISEWAKQQCLEKNIKIVEKIEPISTLFAFDVFEHMELLEIEDVVKNAKPEVIVARIPVSINGGKSFALDVSNNDPTHITCLEKQQWIDFIDKLGYQISFRINLCTVYDTDGVFCFVAVKKNVRNI